MKKIIMLLVSILCITGCGQSEKSELEQIIEKNNYIIVDVRTSEEYKQGHVIGSINIPYDEIASSNLDKNKTILVYCKSGVRSKNAYNTLKSLNYDVYDLGSYETISLDKI